MQGYRNYQTCAKVSYIITQIKSKTLDISEAEVENRWQIKTENSPNIINAGTNSADVHQIYKWDCNSFHQILTTISFLRFRLESNLTLYSFAIFFSFASILALRFCIQTKHNKEKLRSEAYSNIYKLRAKSEISYPIYTI